MFIGQAHGCTVLLHASTCDVIIASGPSCDAARPFVDIERQGPSVVADCCFNDQLHAAAAVVSCWATNNVLPVRGHLV